MQTGHSPAHQEFSNKLNSPKKRKGIIPFLFFFVFLGIGVIFPHERFLYTIPILVLFLIIWIVACDIFIPQEAIFIFSFLLISLFISIYKKPNLFSFYYILLFFTYTLLFIFFLNSDIPTNLKILLLFFTLVFHMVFSFYHIYYLFPEISKNLKDLNNTLPFVKERISVILRKKRLRSFFPLPSEFAFILGALFFSFLHFLDKSNDKNTKKILLFIFPIFTTTILLTKSFELIIAFLFILTFLFFILELTKKQKEALVVAGISIIASFTFLFSFFRWEEFVKFEPLILRLKHWEIAIKEFINYPLFGVGPGNFGVYSSFFLKPGYPESKFSHNFFLQLLSENGIIGAIFIISIAYFIIKIFREKHIIRENIHIYISFIFIMTYNLFDIGIFFETFGIVSVFVFAEILKANNIKTFKLDKKFKGILLLFLFATITLFISISLSKDSKYIESIEKKEKILNVSLNLYPQNTIALYELYKMKIHKKDFNEAKEILEKLIELDPISISLKKEKIKTLIFEKRFYEAYLLCEIYEKFYLKNKFFKNLKDELKKFKR